MNRNYRKLKLSEFNRFDTERILQENIYKLHKENQFIGNMVRNMVEQKIPTPIIEKQMRQIEDNAAESIYINSLIYHSMQDYNFTNSSIYRERK